MQKNDVKHNGMRAMVGPSLLLIMTIGVQAMVESNCTNFKKEIVTSGQRFIPLGYDPCTTCTCRNGQAEMCIAVLCSPPKDCLDSQLADDKCCEFMCKNGVDVDKPPMYNVTTIGTKGRFYGPERSSENDGLNTTNLGLRLVASTVTSFLVLALLLFMIHRLRQRRLLLMIRRINNNHLSRGPCPNRRYSEDDNTVGYYRDRDHVDFGFFQDPPPPYTFWKPPESYFPQGEAPPPYEAVSNFSPAPPLTPHLTTPATGLPLRLPSLSSVSLHANNFQMNDLGQETIRNEENTTSLPLHHLNVVGSMSSLSSQSEINLNEDGPTGDDLVMTLRADAKYEDCPTGDARPIEHHVSNLAVFKEYLPEYDGRPKRRSFSDVLDSWHQPSNLDSDAKRRSLQVPVSSERRQRSNLTPNYCPDPASWMGGGSDSSSSSSPTYDDGRTDSLTSSDSSSFDYNFLSTKTSDRNNLVCQRKASSDNQVEKDDMTEQNVTGESGASGGKANSLDRTLSNLKEKIGRKKKSGNRFKRKKISHEFWKSNVKDDSAGSSSVRQLYPETVKPVQTHSEPTPIPIQGKSYDSSNTSDPTNSNEAIAGTQCDSKSESRATMDCGCSLSIERPHSGSLDSTTCSSRASFGSSLSSPASPARYGVDETPSTSSSCSSSTANYYLNLLHQPSIHASAHHVRSASVCSETGERKHKSRLSLPRDPGEGARAEPRRTRAHTSPSGSNTVRISLDLWHQNHESYI